MENDLVDAINMLLAEKENNSQKKIVSKAELLYKRGLAHYSYGYANFVPDDYKEALKICTDKDLQQKICMGLAAYYYNLPFEMENIEMAYNYLNSCMPKDPDSLLGSPFVIEKSMLLGVLDRAAQIDFAKDLGKANFRKFVQMPEKERGSYRHHDYYRTGMNYLFEAATYCYKLKQYDRAKKMLESCLDYRQKNKQGFILNAYFFSQHYFMLAEIYMQEDYFDAKKATDYLLLTIGDPNFGILVSTEKIAVAIDKLMVYNSELAELQFAKALLIFKEFRNGAGAPLETIKSKLEPYLAKAENLGYDDYQLYMLQAFLYKLEKNAEAALSSAKTALEKSPANPNCYGLRAEIMRFMPNFTEEEKRAASKEATNFNKAEEPAVEELIKLVDDL